MVRSNVRLRAERPNHVWSYDFVQDRTHDGRIYRTLNVIDEFTREALTIRVSRKPNSIDVIDVLTDLFILRGTPEFIRSDDVLYSERLSKLGIRSFSHRVFPMRCKFASGGFCGQPALSPITNTEYA